jgi:hypothetical protein
MSDAVPFPLLNVSSTIGREAQASKRRLAPFLERSRHGFRISQRPGPSSRLSDFRANEASRSFFLSYRADAAS